MKQQCVQCSKTFEITQADQDLHTRLMVPTPTHCPDCRTQRRMVWRNERTLYQRTCDLCHKSIISIYDSSGPYTVYCYDCWYSDKWNGLTYGRPVDFSRPFFEQFKELQLQVPRVYAMALDNENSEYTNGSAYNKNCYLIFVSDHNEDCMYAYGILNCRNSLDNLNVTKSELCYQCVGCTNCYDVQYSVDSSNCSNSIFLLDCKGARNCFMSYGLRTAEYVWKNQQLTKEQYQQKWNELQRGSHRTIERLQLEFENMKKKHTFKYYHGLLNEASSGDYIERCQNSSECYESYELENCKYSIHGNKVKDSSDTYVVVDNSELCYEVVSGIDLYNAKYSYSYWHGREGEYVDSCYHVENVFGCVGLQNQKYCILNQQYSEAEYKTVRDKLIDHMRQTGEYGEFFPPAISPFAYNETAAQDHFPLTQTEAEAQGYRWRPDNVAVAQYSTYRVPDNVTTVKDDILETFLTCEQCKRAYKLLPQELAFYRQQQIPVPRQCQDCRHRTRLAGRNPRHLWLRQCMCTQTTHQHGTQQCAIEFETTYRTENPAIVYCEQCYNQELY